MFIPNQIDSVAGREFHRLLEGNEIVKHTQRCLMTTAISIYCRCKCIELDGWTEELIIGKALAFLEELCLAAAEAEASTTDGKVEEGK